MITFHMRHVKPDVDCRICIVGLSRTFKGLQQFLDDMPDHGQPGLGAGQTILYLNGIYDTGADMSDELEVTDADVDNSPSGHQTRAPGRFYATSSEPMTPMSSVSHVIRGSHDAPERLAQDFSAAGAACPKDVHVHLVEEDGPHSEGKAPAAVCVRPWEPYEAAPRENYLLAYMPLQFYRLRWAFMRCNPLAWPVGRHAFTYGEAVVLALVVLQMAWVCAMWAAHPGFRVDVILTGRLASLALMTTFFLSLHSNTIMLLFFGLPFDRQLPWHKLLACVTVVNGAIHCLAFYLGGRADALAAPWRHHHAVPTWTHAYGMEATGWMLYAPILAMSALGLPAVARRNFAAFYRTHVVLAFCAAVGAAFHGFGSAVAARYLPMSLPGGVFWLFDIIIRFVFGTRLAAEKSVLLRVVASEAAPERTVVEVSVPNVRQHYTAGQWVFLCFPRLGVLHWHPFTISSGSADERLTVHMLCGDRWTGRVRDLAKTSGNVKAYIEGPYGAPMIDVHGPGYKCFVVVSGGIGWTFVRSWKRQLVADAARGRPVKMVSTIAILKASDAHQLPEFVGWDIPGADSHNSGNMRAQEDVFLTGKQAGGDDSSSLLRQSDAPGVKVSFGRPDLGSLFASAARTATAVGERRVAVMVCGNQGIVDRILAAARDAGTQEVAFDCHYEKFSF